MAEPSTGTRRDRTYGPILLVGLAGAALLAVAGHRDWIDLGTSAAQEGTMDVFRDANPGLAQVPAAGALGLVVLACWGVLLVLRGVWRRAAAVLGVLAGAGAVVAWIQGRGSLMDDVSAKVDATAASVDVTLTWSTWSLLALAGAVITTLASVVAVVRVGGWPEMGSRYDAPTQDTGSLAASPGEADAPADLSEADPTDVWKAIDAGQDPT